MIFAVSLPASSQDVSVFLQEYKAPDILLGVIAKSRNPRLTVSHFTTGTVLPASSRLKCISHYYLLNQWHHLFTQSFSYRKSVLEFWVIWLVSMKHVYLSARTLTLGMKHSNTTLSVRQRISSSVMQCHIL